MKKDIHPKSYRHVAFTDLSTGDNFITRSCADTKDKVTIDGVEYPQIKLEISNLSHPFFTGKMKFVDSAGRIDKFTKKFGGGRFAARIDDEE